MRRLKLFSGSAFILVLLVALCACSLPQVTFKTTSPQPPQIPTVTVTVPAELPSTPVTSSSPAATTPIATSETYPSLADIIARARTSVVAINTVTTGRSVFGITYNQPGDGSGWIIDSKGLIVTNNHVVKGADKITVTLEDGRSFRADNVRTDSVSDLAVLKIDAQDLPALKVGDSTKSRVGDWVIAIGNSLGNGISATKGIISAKGVSVTADNGETMYDLLQTDAAINPGNSGGPLVNLAGEVIGINSIKVVQVGVEGMGYAISSQVAIPIINELITNGYVARPWIGARLYTVDSYAINQLNLKVKSGVLIIEVVSGGPASKAGLKRYDVITAFNNQEVNSVESLIKLIRNRKIGDVVQIGIWRDSGATTVNLTLEQAPPS